MHTLKEEKFKKRLIDKGGRVEFLGILLLAADEAVKEAQVFGEPAAKKADTGIAQDLVDKRRSEMERKGANAQKLKNAKRDTQTAFRIK